MMEITSIFGRIDCNGQENMYGEESRVEKIRRKKDNQVSKTREGRQ
jgi:hypothetical protein